MAISKMRKGALYLLAVISFLSLFGGIIIVQGAVKSDNHFLLFLGAILFIVGFMFFLGCGGCAIAPIK